MADRMLSLLSPLIANSHNDGDEHFGDADNEGDQPDNHDDHDQAEEFATLPRSQRIDCFDRRAVNQQLAQQDEMTAMRAVA